MKRFKHGDKIECYIGGVYIDDARISIGNNGIPYICQNITNSTTADNLLGYKYSYMLDNKYFKILLDL